MPDGPVTPSALLDDLDSEIEFLTEVAETRADPLKSASVYEQLGAAYRAVGICLLSRDGDTDAFFHCLIQSALARRHYLTAAAAAAAPEPGPRRASLIAPALDALAARQWRLATELFSLVSHTFSEGEEYEDDFCWAELLRRVVVPGAEAVDDLLSRWEAVLDGGIDRRLDVARALVARDAGAFAEALVAHLDAEEAKSRALADPLDGALLADELPFFPNRWISVEGLALLALAERHGMVVPGPFRGCPPLARASTFGAFHPRGFPHVTFVKE